jgi:outer membrane beta-barrel protein
MKATPLLRILLVAVLAALSLPTAARADETPASTEAKPAPSEARPGSDSPAATEGTESGARARTALSQEVAEQGEAELRKSVRVFQQRYLIKTHRAELLLGGSSSFNDPMIHHFGADASLLFHLSERWALGIGAAKWFGKPRDAFNKIQSDYGLFPEKSELQAGGWGEVQYSPVFGKFTSFGVAVLQVDAYVLAGGGAIRTTRGESLKGAGQVGVGIRVHTLRWLTLSFEIRDLIYSEAFQPCEANHAATDACSNQVLNQWFGGLRLGLWIPPTVQYKFQR